MPGRFEVRRPCRAAASIGTADSTQKDAGFVFAEIVFAEIVFAEIVFAEIVFEGTESPCYPWLRMGVEGIITTMSRRPN
ncbi:MAG: hypothetical protein ACJ8FZ_06905 [Bradyrhizobium sp.]